eukprot:scaffold7147_cov130-Isochrysis_galbana.AAC.14
MGLAQRGMAFATHKARHRLPTALPKPRQWGTVAHLIRPAVPRGRCCPTPLGSPLSWSSRAPGRRSESRW